MIMEKLTLFLFVVGLLCVPTCSWAENWNSSYKVTVVEQPARRLAGLRVRTNMRDSQKDCPDLWEKFTPSMEELARVAEAGSFGASVNLDANGDFDYWAAMAVPQGAKAPSDMDCLEVKGGKYAQVVVENLANLGAAYQYMYAEWEKTQNDYRVDFTGACLEFYPKDWRDGDLVTIYVPLK